MDINVVKAAIKGVVTFIPFVSLIINIHKRNKHNHSGSNALFCYTLWMKIITFLQNSNCPIQFESIAEIGSGGSLGLGFCALLTGSKKYTILEIEKNFDSNKNLQLFEEILSLFKANTKVPSNKQFEQINIKTNDIEYYNRIIDQVDLGNYLSDKRIREIRENILFKSSNLIEYNFDWGKNPPINAQFDLLFSRAVMEHVNSPNLVYKNIYNVLKSGGIMLHDIEFHSHGITKSWYGHNKLNIM
ncbi:methyltransferase domain-containing protein [Bacteroidota bacterium]